VRTVWQALDNRDAGIGVEEIISCTPQSIAHVNELEHYSQNLAAHVAQLAGKYTINTFQETFECRGISQPLLNEGLPPRCELAEVYAK
jgi:hypothetical protein